MKKLITIASFILISLASTTDVNAQTNVVYKTTVNKVQTENPLYVNVTGVSPCCIALVTKTLMATPGVKSTSYDNEKGLYVITADENFKLSDAQNNVLNAGKEHDRKLNLKDRPEWALSVVDVTSNASNEKKAQCCEKSSSAKGKSCMATPSIEQESPVKQTVKQENAEIVKLKITGLTCADCASHVHKVLKETEGVIDNSVEYPGDIAVVHYIPDQTNPELIRAAIKENTSYTAELLKDEAPKKN